MRSGDHTAEDFEAAQSGRGTRPLTTQEARWLLEHCAQKDWAFQSMETTEIVGELEYPRLDLSLLGLTRAEALATTPNDLETIVRDVLERTDAEARQFSFKVWVNSAEAILAKNRGG